MKKSLVDKVDGLMSNPYKNVVRVDIMNQVSDFSPRGHTGALKVMTLPGTNFVFEEMLAAQLRYFGKDVRFACFEAIKERFEFTRQEVPQNVDLTYGRFEKYLKGSNYDVVWADYCCTIKAPKALVNAIRAATAVPGKETLLYVSFCLSRVDYRELGWRWGSPGCTPIRVVERCIERNLKSKGIRYRKIYSVNYTGGSNAAVPMLTVGYHINCVPHVRSPKLIEENRRRTGTDRYKIVKAPAEVRKPSVIVSADELSAYVLRMFRNNVTKSGHTLQFCLHNKNWRKDFMRRCMKKYGCPWQRPTGILNGLRRELVKQ